VNIATLLCCKNVNTSCNYLYPYSKNIGTPLALIHGKGEKSLPRVILCQGGLNHGEHKAFGLVAGWSYKKSVSGQLVPLQQVS
jgi:hypothetical protein